ncbi:unnamed protein product, partial [Urochloa humidicola]
MSTYLNLFKWVMGGTNHGLASTHADVAACQFHRGSHSLQKKQIASNYWLYSRTVETTYERPTGDLAARGDRRPRMEPTLRSEGHDPPVYGPNDEQFSVEVHHGGFFCGLGANRLYIDERINWFDHCEPDTWSLLRVDDFIEKLGHTKTNKLKVYWCLPGKSIVEGLRLLNKDADTNSMTSVVPRVRNLVLYFDHNDFIRDARPKRTPIVEKSESLFAKFAEEQSSNRESTTTEHEGEVQDEMDDPDFIDSDYEMGDGDDDLFEDNVDKIAEDDLLWKEGMELADEMSSDS